jgi:hypothetical protein
MAMEKMLGGLSGRRYRVGLEPVGEKVERVDLAQPRLGWPRIGGSLSRR